VGNHSLHTPTRANIPTSPYGSRRFRAKWNTRNWLAEAGISRSDTLQNRPGRGLLRRKLSPHGRSGRRRVASRNQKNWFAATAGAMTWRRVSSNGGIVDAASVSANAMDQPQWRRRRRSRSRATSSEGGRARKGVRLFSVLSYSACGKPLQPIDSKATKHGAA
jgi:hypothetical protein